MKCLRASPTSAERLFSKFDEALALWTIVPVLVQGPKAITLCATANDPAEMSRWVMHGRTERLAHWSAYPPTLSIIADIVAQQPGAKSGHSGRRSDPRNVSPGSLVSLLGVSSVADAHETGEHQSRVASAC